MMNFIMGWIMGKNSNKHLEPVLEPHYPVVDDDKPIEEILEIPKVYKYVPIPDITDFSATLETSYDDYENTNLVAIYKNGHTYYYLEVYVYETQTMWGDEKALDFI